MSQPLAAVNVSQSFQNLLDTVVHSIPKVLVFLVILVIGWIVARLVKQAIVVVLRKLKFDRFVERGVIGQALARSNYDASSLIAMIVYYAVLLFALQLAFGVFGTNPISTMLDAIIGWLPKAIVAIVLVVVASAIAKVVKDLITAAIGGLSYGRFVATLASVVIIALGVIAALSQIGIATAITGPVLITVLATVGAILAIGVGGGMIRPMQSRWERILNAAEQETQHQLSAYQRGRDHAMRTPAAAGEQRGEHAGSGEEGAPAGYGTTTTTASPTSTSPSPERPDSGNPLG